MEFYSEEIEESLLSALFNAEEVDIKLLEINESDLFKPINQYLFQQIKLVFDEGNRPDHLLLAQKIKNKFNLTESESIEKAGALLYKECSKDNINHYAKKIKSYSKKRILISILNNSLKEIESSAIDNMVEKIQSEINQIYVSDKTSVMISRKDATKDFIKGLNEENAGKIKTGYQNLDEILNGGLTRKNLIILAARPSIGKTTFVLNICQGIKEPVAFFSYEMSTDELLASIYSASAQINKKRLMAKNLNHDELPKLAKIIKSENLKKEYYSTKYLNVGQLKKECIKLNLKEKLGLIVIDYIQLMPPEDNKVIREQQVATISRKLKELAIELDVPIIALSQLNRDSSKREKKEPQLYDLRESGSLEQDANIVLMLHRDEISDKRTKLYIRKNRSGEVGQIEFDFYGKYSNFVEVPS